jgi:hypothetical protein
MWVILLCVKKVVVYGNLDHVSMVWYQLKALATYEDVEGKLLYMVDNGGSFAKDIK